MLIDLKVLHERFLDRVINHPELAVGLAYAAGAVSVILSRVIL